MIQEPNENLEHPFSDEMLTEGEQYIEKFQEILFAHHEAPPQLLESLRKQSKKTLLDLRDIITDTIDKAENKAKYEQVVKSINGLIDASRL